MAFVPNTVNGLPNGPQGYSPNTRPNNNQTILTNELAINALLDISTSTIRPAYFLSKKNLLVQDTNFVLPTYASVAAGNLWLSTEGLIPDTLAVDSVQGNVSGVPPVLATGTNVNVVPFPETGTIILAMVSYTSGDVMAINAPLYVKADGTLTATSSAAVNSAYAVGYVLTSDKTTIGTTGVYQMYVVLNPKASVVPYVSALSSTFAGGGTTTTISVPGMVVGDKVQVTLNAAATVVALKAIAATNQINVTFSADPGAGTVMTYSVWH